MAAMQEVLLSTQDGQWMSQSVPAKSLLPQVYIRYTLRGKGRRPVHTQGYCCLCDIAPWSSENKLAHCPALQAPPLSFLMFPKGACAVVSCPPLLELREPVARSEVRVSPLVSLYWWPHDVALTDHLFDPMPDRESMWLPEPLTSQLFHSRVLSRLHRKTTIHHTTHAPPVPAQSSKHVATVPRQGPIAWAKVGSVYGLPTSPRAHVDSEDDVANPLLIVDEDSGNESASSDSDGDDAGSSCNPGERTALNENDSDSEGEQSDVSDDGPKSDVDMGDDATGDSLSYCPSDDDDEDEPSM